jgi:hypothetical protein
MWISRLLYILVGSTGGRILDSLVPPSPMPMWWLVTLLMSCIVFAVLTDRT